MADADVGDEELRQYLELWKQTVAVQQHFNDLEWKIRGLALTALTFTLGAAAVSAREPAKIKIFGGHISLAVLVTLAGLIVWCTFWFVDAIWYHPLLIGSVRHGEQLEGEIRKRLPAAGLTGAISESSAVHLFKNKNSRFEWRRDPKLELHSRHKLRLFYLVIALVLVGVAVGLSGTSASKVGGPTPLPTPTHRPGPFPPPFHGPRHHPHERAGVPGR